MNHHVVDAELYSNVQDFFKDYARDTHCALCGNPIYEININGVSRQFDHNVAPHCCPESVLCPNCNGSGEGRADGTCCGRCSGSGEVVR